VSISSSTSSISSSASGNTKKGLQVYVHPPSGMIWDDTEGGKPEFGDGAVHFCEDVSSMSCLPYYYHWSYPSGLSLLIQGHFYT
jgi:hypothetical protein